MFENIKVPEAFKKSITTVLSQNRLSHAVIIEGADADLTFAAAKEIAAYLQCTSTQRPCWVCSICVKCEGEAHPDIHFIKRKTGSPLIKVDEIRELKKLATVLPNDSEKSIFIIEDAQNMNVQAQNALLKIFEEPAKHVCFILTCRTKSPLLDTIISRATCYYIGEESRNEQEKQSSQSEALASELMDIYVSSNEFEFLKKTAVFQKDKQLFKSVLEGVLPIIRDAMILKSGGTETISSHKECAQKMSNALTQRKIIDILNAVKLMIEQAENYANHNLLTTRFCSVLYSIKTSN